MRETKVQKIARLEKKIEEQKKEMSEIKKDRKRLNYAVERLERKIQKLSAQSSKEDAAKIKELENKLEKAREYCKDLVAKHNKSVAVFREIARRNKILRNSPEISDKDFNMKRLSYFMRGLYEDIDGFPLFDFDTLITRVNILNGGWITEEISRKIKERLENNETYKETLKRCEPYIEAAKNYDKEASDFIIMEVWKLLRVYSDIFIDDWFDTANCIPDGADVETEKEHRF